MINGIKISLIYHLYCKDEKSLEVGTGNVYNEINRRCLEHFHNVFDDAVFCVCMDDTGNSRLLQRAIEWIWSCGFKDNVTIKVKQNTPYWDAQTFYDEVVDHIANFDGMVFFGHNKGNTHEDTLGIRQWIAFSYYSCLDRINEYVKQLCNHVMAYFYVPTDTEDYFNKREYTWMVQGTFMLFNPRKVVQYINRSGRSIPPLVDRFSAELFFPRLVPSIKYDESFAYQSHFAFEDDYDCAFCSDHEVDYRYIEHLGFLSYFLTEERINDYKKFYDTITRTL